MVLRWCRGHPRRRVCAPVAEPPARVQAARSGAGHGGVEGNRVGGMSALSPRTDAIAQPQGFRDKVALRVDTDDRERFGDKVIAEAPIALVYNGVSFAVMMATPCDLPDFALGFTLAEGIVGDPTEFELVDILRTDRGVTLQGLIPGARFEALQARRRSLAGRSGCGLCGVEALEDAVRPLPRVQSRAGTPRAAVIAGMGALAHDQPLNAARG
ncbi:MAG: hypothetical protein EPN40_02015, partial [Rhodanobacteraceae bacterium]